MPKASFAYVVLIFILGLSVGLAQVSAASAAGQPVSESRLREALQHYQNLKTLQVKFKQTKLLKDMDMPLQSEGELELAPPANVIFRITKPAALLVTLTPEMITIESGEGASKTVQEIKSGQIPSGREKASLQAMVSWLKMDAKVLSQAYDVTQVTDTKTAVINYVFKPRDPQQSPFAELSLNLNREGHVKKIVMNETSGDKIEFNFENPKVTYKK